MDFIERFFGISPDGGNGTFEVLCIVVFVAGALVLTLGWRKVVQRPKT
jgi:hypothetical protein